MPSLWDLAPGAPVYLGGSLNFSSSSALSLAALAFALVTSPLCSRVGRRLMQATVPISACCRTDDTGGSPQRCASCFPQTWHFCGVLGTPEKWHSLDKHVTKARKVLFFFPPPLQASCRMYVRVTWASHEIRRMALTIITNHHEDF